MKILNRYTKETIFEDNNVTTIRELVELAIKNGADLSEADLIGADLRRAYLRGIDLSEANLYRVNLRGADLRGTNLSEAYLRGANLRGANLCGAYLQNTSIKSFTLGKHFAFYHEGYLKIGCHGMELDEWSDKYEEIGKERSYSEDEIFNYGLMIKTLKEMR